MHGHFRHRVLGRWAGFVARRSSWVLLVWVAVAAVAVVVTVLRLEFQSNRNDLISKDLDWNQRFIDWTGHFPGQRDIFVVIDPGPRDGPQWDQRLARAKAAADRLGQVLRPLDHIHRVAWRFKTARYSPKAVRMAPMDEFKQRLDMVRLSRPMLVSRTPNALLGATIQQLRQQGEADVGDDPRAQALLALAIDEFAGAINQLGNAIDSAQAVGDHATEGNVAIDGSLGPGVGAGADADTWQYQLSGRLLFVRVTPFDKPGAINAPATAIKKVRQTVADIAPRFPDIEMGVTGMEVIEGDETAAATRDSAIATTIAAVLITVVLIVAFHGLRVPLLIMLSLITGIAVSFGAVTLAVGHLQVISVVFTVIVLGLGVAYGIHVASAFELVRHDCADGKGGMRQALRISIENVGPGVITGAVTTAVAFCTTLLTKFVGVAEMGLIAAIGIVLCLAAMMSVFPAMLRRWAPRRVHHTPVHDRPVMVFSERWAMPFVRHPILTAATALAVSVVSVIGALRLEFDSDLLKLQPRGLDSVYWQNRVVEHSGRAIWTGTSLAANLEQARQRVQKFRQLDTVSPQLGGVGLLMPADEDDRVAVIHEVRGELGEALATAAEHSDAASTQSGAGLSVMLSAMRVVLSQQRVQADVPPVIAAALNRLDLAIEQFVTRWAPLPVEQHPAASQRIQSAFERWRDPRVAAVRAMLDPTPLSLSDVPPEMMRSYVASDGRVALEVAPDPAAITAYGEDAGPLHPTFLNRFCNQMSQVDPGVTGVIVQIFNSGNLIRESYKMVGALALIVVLVLVFLDFQRLDDALLSLAPVVISFAVTFGVMHLLGMNINPANIIALPLMFGIGVGSGLHVLHRCRIDPATRPLGLTAGTGKGVMLTSATAVIGFGSMMLASHRGIASLGFVMALGLTLTAVSCWVVMPALLELRAQISDALQKKS